MTKNQMINIINNQQSSKKNHKYSSSSSTYTPDAYGWDCECKTQNERGKCTAWHCLQQDKTDTTCFPANSLVKMADNTTKNIQDLKQGDKIMTYDNNGKLIQDEVISFLHYEEGGLHNYLEVEYNNEKQETRTLDISYNHYIYIDKNKTEKVGKLKSNVSNVFTVGESEANFFNTSITKITNVQKKGAYAPLTKTGSLIVNNTFVSCYSSVLHEYAHKAFAPFRAAYELSPNFLKKYFDLKIGGINWYAKGLMLLYNGMGQPNFLE